MVRLTEALEELKEYLTSNPLSMTDAVEYANRELGLQTHIARAQINLWIERGVIGERSVKDTPGPGRPKRMVGGEPL